MLRGERRATRFARGKRSRERACGSQLDHTPTSTRPHLGITYRSSMEHFYASRAQPVAPTSPPHLAPLTHASLEKETLAKLKASLDAHQVLELDGTPGPARRWTCAPQIQLLRVSAQLVSPTFAAAHSRQALSSLRWLHENIQRALQRSRLVRGGFGGDRGAGSLRARRGCASGFS